MNYILYFVGMAISWYLMFRFACWYGPRTWKHTYHPTMLEYQRKVDLEHTGLLSLWWPISLPAFFLISLILGSFKK